MNNWEARTVSRYNLSSLSRHGQRARMVKSLIFHTCLSCDRISICARVYIAYVIEDCCFALSAMHAPWSPESPVVSPRLNSGASHCNALYRRYEFFPPATFIPPLLPPRLERGEAAPRLLYRTTAGNIERTLPYETLIASLGNIVY
jgi:hypothetical protein